MVLAVAVAAFLAVSSTRLVVRALGVYRERRAVADRIRELEGERSRIEAAVSAIAAPAAVERLAKERLNLKRPGEEVVVVVPEPDAPPAPQQARWRIIPPWLRELLGFLAR